MVLLPSGKQTYWWFMVNRCYDYVIVTYNMGVSENSVPLKPMVTDHYPVFKWLFHWEYSPNIFRQTHIYIYPNQETIIKPIWGWFPLLTMIPVRENSELVIIYPDNII